MNHNESNPEAMMPSPAILPAMAESIIYPSPAEASTPTQVQEPEEEFPGAHDMRRGAASQLHRNLLGMGLPLDEATAAANNFLAKRGLAPVDYTSRHPGDNGGSAQSAGQGLNPGAKSENRPSLRERLTGQTARRVVGALGALVLLGGLHMHDRYEARQKAAIDAEGDKRVDDVLDPVARNAAVWIIDMAGRLDEASVDGFSVQKYTYEGDATIHISSEDDGRDMGITLETGFDAKGNPDPSKVERIFADTEDTKTEPTRPYYTQNEVTRGSDEHLEGVTRSGTGTVDKDGKPNYHTTEGGTYQVGVTTEDPFGNGAKSREESAAVVAESLTSTLDRFREAFETATGHSTTTLPPAK